REDNNLSTKSRCRSIDPDKAFIDTKEWRVHISKETRNDPNFDHETKMVVENRYRDLFREIRSSTVLDDYTGKGRIYWNSKFPKKCEAFPECD
ncbi:hypothetical protein G9O61_00g019680, partial [Vairimorpha ceranae]